PAGLRAVAEAVRLPADDRSGADREEIGTHGDFPREDQDTRPDLRAQRPQIQPVQRRTDEKMDARVRPDQGLDDPEADVAKTPKPDALGFPATDDQPLGDDRNGAHDEERHPAEQDQPQVALDTLRSRHNPLVAGNG